MSLNTAHTDGGVVIYQGELILLHAPSTILSFSGSDELKKFVEITGNSYLTTHRLIFLTKGSKSDLKSFSLPFCVLSEVDVEQPVFGSNYLKGKVRAQPNGNWRGEAKWKLQFKAGGAIDFAQGMMKAIYIARQTTAQNQYWNEPPPAYATATFMPAPTAYYAPPPSYYGWNYAPNGYNFPPPEAGTVYVNEAPPPYPGIGGGFQGVNQQGAFQQPGANVGFGPQTGNPNYYNGGTPQPGNTNFYGGPPQQPGNPNYYNGGPPQQTGNPNFYSGGPPQQPGYAPPQYTPQYSPASAANGNAATAPPYTEHYDKKQN